MLQEAMKNSPIPASEDGASTAMSELVAGMPLRSILNFMGEQVSEEMIQDFINKLNE